MSSSNESFPPEHTVASAPRSVGFSALADAVRHEHKDIQKLLLAAGGKLLGMDEAVDLCTAAAEGNVTKISSLLEGRANPNAKDYDGR